MLLFTQTQAQITSCRSAQFKIVSITSQYKRTVHLYICKFALINNYLNLWVFLQAHAQTTTTRTTMRNGLCAILDDKNVYGVLDSHNIYIVPK